MKMQNKKALEAEKRRKLKEERRAKKASRQKETSLIRDEQEKLSKPKILIYCEGENTEPSYFKQFKLVSAEIRVFGEGRNTLSLVNKAIEIASKKSYDQVWCVFDRDSFSKSDFNNAIGKAEKHGFGVAYSNQAFEYWVILHFKDHQGEEIHRTRYNEIINNEIKNHQAEYDGNGSKKISKKLFELMMANDSIYNKARYKLAIERAKRNYKQFSGTTPADAESSTTVFRLVEEIIKYI